MVPSRLILAFLLAVSAGCLLRPAAAEPLHLILPTSNDALLRGDGPGFFMFTDRNFQGRRSQPWEGGQYGYVRNPKEMAGGVVYTRFHEGVDIRPVYRDGAGEPLDTVRTIDDGYVVYVNNVEARSNYGKYVVVEHWWSGSPFYSLYAHLGAVHVRAGEQVVQGQRLGRMGYTGRGIDRRRAHVHFEINMLLNQNYPEWHRSNVRGSNWHDVFHGYNLAGLDVPALYLALQRDPSMTIEDFFAQQPVFFEVAVPNEGPLDLMYRYPFLSTTRNPWLATGAEQPRAWEIGFTKEGLPVRIAPSTRRVAEPEVVAAERTDFPYAYVTGGTVTGTGRSYALSSSGKRFMSLLTLPGDQDATLARQLAEELQARQAGAGPPVRRAGYKAPQPVEPVHPPKETLSVEEASRRVAEELEARKAGREQDRSGAGSGVSRERVRGW